METKELVYCIVLDTAINFDVQCFYFKIGGKVKYACKHKLDGDFMEWKDGVLPVISSALK